ncbi:hypothetical protein HWC29_gp131 [Aeromonas phage 4_4572]|uniref:Thioredoxin domain-containing protein n=1 Tax=Aeromonas phage 4_4572 TaxID=2588517 RepID=A0A5B9N888_9CAUD|nr:hypothetical protein HWC29_gp131 [Aeromonas phage 4_4572]QEG09055.1 hypothetical protein [Aeromonas phage 4_4572]
MTNVKFFTAAWCVNCKNIKPVVEQYANVEYVDIDTEAGMEAASKLGIRGIPTLVKEDGEKISGANIHKVKEFLGVM